jgi:capsular polysaccharide transport system permease protein
MTENIKRIAPAGAAAEKTSKPAPKTEPKKADGPGTGKGAGKGGAPKPPPQKKAAEPVVEIRPVASAAAMKRRHWGLMASFVILVVLPLIALGVYLWTVAEDQYSSTTGFTVRSEEGGSASEMLGGLAQFAGASTASDSDILYEFIQSQKIVRAIDERINLRAHYAAPWPRDVLFAIWPEASIEDLVWYWQRIVRISYDQSTGLIEVRVLAFDAGTAQTIASEILSQSQNMINALNIQAREDAMGYARADLDEAVERLKSAREALTRFRTRTRIVDPATDIQGRMGVMANLQQQLAEALIEYDLLAETVASSDPRLTTARRQIEVIRSRIASERSNFASASTETGELGEDYPSLISEYESLSVDREFAEETYRVALAALDIARDNAARQSRYLASYIQPTLADEPEFPRRVMLMALAALALGLSWSILALIYYSIRDRG